MNDVAITINKQLQFVSKDKLETMYKQLETKHRTNNFEYTNCLTNDMMQMVKSTWAEHIRNSIKEYLKSIANGNLADAALIRKSMIHSHRKLMTTPNFDYRQFAVNLSTCSIFNKVCDFHSPTKNTLSINGKSILTKWSTNPYRLVVNVKDVEQADIYMYAYWNETLELALVLGWINKEDLKQANHGNKESDSNCPWFYDAYYVPVSDLKPISSLMTTEIKYASNSFFETIPMMTEFPVLANPSCVPTRSGLSLEDAEKELFSSLG